MRFARRSLGLGLLAAVNLAVIACTGGPGDVDQGGDRGEQYSGVSGDNGQTVSSGTNDEPNATATATATTQAPPPDLKASDYDQSCTQDTDCQAVYIGSPCAACTCPNAGINGKDVAKYSGDKTNAGIQCALAGKGPTGQEQCSPCQSVSPHCDGNRCTAR